MAARLRLHIHAVPQQRVDGFIVVIQAAVRVHRLGFEEIDRAADLLGRVSRDQMLGNERVLNIAVARTIAPVAEISIPELVAK